MTAERTFGVRGRDLALLVVRPRAEDKVRVERHRIDPVSVLGERANELALMESINRQSGS